MSRSRLLTAVTFLVAALMLVVLPRSPMPGPDVTPGKLPSWVAQETQTLEEGDKKERKGPSGAMKALEYWGAQRAYPNEVIPDESYGVALAQHREMRARDAESLEHLVDPWEPLGPANVGGRTLCLALHPDDPDIIFAGSASGGLWKSTVGGVGGDAWDHVDVGYPVLGVSTIAIQPMNPDVMYIGTGEAYRYEGTMGGEVIRTTRGSYGVGILKTTDGGSTWSPSLDWSYQQSRGVWMTQIHPVNPNIVYAATTEGIYKSTDAGASWTLVHDVIMGMDVRIHPTNPSTVFAAHGNFGSEGHGIYRSTNDGQSWTKLTLGLPTSWNGKAQLAIAPTSPNVIFASIANEGVGRGLYKSYDEGDVWTRINSTDYQQYQGWYSHYVLVSPFDEETLFTGGIEIWRSTNGGSTLDVMSRWQDVYMGLSPPEGPIGGPNYAHADHHFAVWHPTDPNTVFFASDGGVFKSTNLGDSFASLIGGYQTSQFYNGFSNSGTSPDFAMGGLQDNFTVSYNGTNAWYRHIGGDGSWTAINPLMSTTVYGSYYYLNMYRSYTGAGPWDNVTPPEHGDDYSPFIAPFVLCPSQPSVLYAGRSHVFRSDSEGDSWITTNGHDVLSGGNPIISMAVGAANPDTAYAGTAPITGRARLFTTRDGGTSWMEITGPLPDRYPSDIAVDPNDAAKVYVTFMGFGTSHVFKSMNGGDSWIDISIGLPDIPATAVEIDPDYPDVIYVGTDLGAYVSIDAGVSWQTFTAGMPLAMVNDLKVYRPTRKIRAATHGNGAYERDLYDPTATSVGQPADAAARTLSLRVQPNPLEPESRITFALPREGWVTASVYDASGRRVATIVDELRSAGSHVVPINQKDIPSGVYYIRLETEIGVATTRVIKVR